MDGPYLCPNCGSTEASQITTQTEHVVADENGEPENIEVEYVDVNHAECADCGETLIE